MIQKIYVTEGQIVKQGDNLIELDTTLTGADVEQIDMRLMALELDRARLMTVLDSTIPFRKVRQ